MGISIKLEDGRKLIFSNSVIERLLTYRQVKKRQKEAGGLLIGRHLLEEDYLVVDKITEPTRWDTRLRNFFFRSNRHNQLVFKEWKKSDQTETLLGLWHTHPEAVPNPSQVDFKDWQRTLLHGDYVGNILFFVIVGTRNIRLWQGDRRAQFIELKIIPISTLEKNNE